MAIERYYTDSDLKEGTPVTLGAQEFHHLTHVMRARSGDLVELINGRGTLAQARLDKIEKKEASLSVESAQHFPSNEPHLILAQGLPRSNRLDFILEKGTELGVSEIWLFPGEKSERQELSPNQEERAQLLLIAATKQCGRLWLPKLALKPKLKKWESLPGQAFFGDVSQKAPWLSSQIPDVRAKEIIFFVGPESGFTPQEEEKLKELGAMGVKLHFNILRTDTAAIAALCLLSVNARF